MKYITLFLLAALIVTGCAVPKVVNNERDQQCNLVTREITIDFSDAGSQSAAQAIGNATGQCNQPACLVVIPLAALSIVVTSVVVSGSIAIAGNTLYWIEQQGKCDNSATKTAIQHLVEAGGMLVSTGEELIEWFSQGSSND